MLVGRLRPRQNRSLSDPSLLSPMERSERPADPPPPGGGSALFPPGRISLGSFGNRPIPFPFPLVDNGALYFLPSLPQPPPHTTVGPERAGNIGHTAGLLWADLCFQAQRGRVMLGDEIVQWNEIVLPPAPAHSPGGRIKQELGTPTFQTGTVRLLGIIEVAKFPYPAVFRDKNPISGTQGIGKGYPEDKGLVILSLNLFTL